MVPAPAAGAGGVGGVEEDGAPPSATGAGEGASAGAEVGDDREDELLLAFFFLSLLLAFFSLSFLLCFVVRYF